MDKIVLHHLATKYKDHIQPPYNVILDLCGLEALCVITDHLGGNVYIPNVRTMFKKCIIQDIQQNTEKKSNRELARRYGISERHVRNLRLEKDF